MREAAEAQDSEQSKTLLEETKERQQSHRISKDM